MQYPLVLSHIVISYTRSGTSALRALLWTIVLLSATGLQDDDAMSQEQCRALLRAFIYIYIYICVYDLSNFGIDEEIKQYFFFPSVLHADLNTAIQTNCESK